MLIGDIYQVKETDEQTLERYEATGLVRRFDWVGSRVTCDPAPANTDKDVLVHVFSLKAFRAIVTREGFEKAGSELCDDSFDAEEGMQFASFTRGRLNIIATDSDAFHGRFLAASSVAKRFNLLRKQDRVALFQAVLYGNACD